MLPLFRLSRLPRLSIAALLCLGVCFSLSACKKPPEKADDKAAAAEQAPLLVAPEDILTLQTGTLASGPVVTGSIEPERKADLRAEVSAVVLQVLKEPGQTVRRGDVLVRLDDTSIRDNVNSAEDAVRNANLALEQAERNVQRLKTLRASGMTSLQSLDEAEVRRDSAHSEKSAAVSRAVQARQQLQRTLIRAPFDGVVSDRKVSAGDTASIGKELLKVIDPTSLRFSGRVSADKISAVKVGQMVSFRVNGYAGQDFKGKVSHVDPSADSVTRQVEVLVSFVDNERPTVSGLYAEGTIESSQMQVLGLPEGVLTKVGDKVYVWCIRNHTLNKVELSLGQRDARTGYYEIKSGLSAGDVILRSASPNLKAGQAVQMGSPKAPAAPSVPASSAPAVPATSSPAAA